MRVIKKASFLVNPSHAAFSLYLNSDAAINFEYSRSTLTFDGNGVNFADDVSRIVALTASVFLGNSFYVNAGAGHRYLRYKGLDWLDSSLKAAFDVVDDYPTIKYHDTGVILGAGNRWHWDYFTLGFDWLRLYAPVSDADVEFVGPEPTEEFKIEELKKRETNTGYSLMTALTLGVSF